MKACNPHLAEDRKRSAVLLSQIAELTLLGQACRQIAAELKASKTFVHRWQKKLPPEEVVGARRLSPCAKWFRRMTCVPAVPALSLTDRGQCGASPIPVPGANDSEIMTWNHERENIFTFCPPSPHVPIACFLPATEVA
jgi:hypothetical protein